MAPDGSEDKKIHITGIEDYSVEGDDNEDPFSDEEGGENGKGEEREDEEGEEEDEEEGR